MTDTAHTHSKTASKMASAGKPKQTRNLLELTEHVFGSREVEPKKSRGDVLYERNVARKQLRTAVEERKEAEETMEREVDFVFQMLSDNIKETTDKDTGKKRLWEFYARHPHSKRVFTKHTTGEKTHRATLTIVGRGMPEVVDAHVLPCGTYYKKWKEGDEPAFFLQDTPINPSNFTISDDGTLMPIRKY
jgi:hypothetical protein